MAKTGLKRIWRSPYQINSHDARHGRGGVSPPTLKEKVYGRFMARVGTRGTVFYDLYLLHLHGLYDHLPKRTLGPRDPGHFHAIPLVDRRRASTATRLAI